MERGSEDAEELFRRSRQGDGRAFEELCRRLFERLTAEFGATIGRALRRQYDTHDLAQSAIADAIKGMEALPDATAFYNLALKICRRKLEQKRWLLRWEAELALCYATPRREAFPPVEASLAKAEDLQLLLEALAQAFPGDDESMALVRGFYWEKKSIGDLALERGISQRTVYRKLRDARTRLREWIRLQRRPSLRGHAPREPLDPARAVDPGAPKAPKEPEEPGGPGP